MIYLRKKRSKPVNFDLVCGLIVLFSVLYIFLQLWRVARV